MFAALLGWASAQFLHLPATDGVDTFVPKATTRVFAANQQQVASFALERRIVLDADHIPDILKLAIVAIEDADFYDHVGVDLEAVLRAAWFSLKDRRIGSRGGASTLTQQLALNLFLTREHTLRRKFKEMLLAIDLEKRLTKDQIITMYANQVFLGHGAYGVEAASLLYFDESAVNLTLAQAALLAGMIQSPNGSNNPFRNPEGALKRRNKVLKNMLAKGFIDEPAFLAASESPLGAALHRDRVEGGAYFLEMVRQEIEEKYGRDSLYTSGLEIHLTMDPDLQKMAENAVRNGLVNLEMRLGFRDPENVLTKGLAESAEVYEDPSWAYTPLQAGDLAYAVVLEVTAEEARLRIDERTARLLREDAKWTARSLKRALDPGDRVLVRLPDPLPEDENDVLAVELLQDPKVEAALLAMDNRTGDVLAMVGGFDFHRSEFNRAIQALRQCGSAFKPFVYLAAFEQGFTPADTLFDAPFLLPDGEGELTYCPKNYYNKYYGLTTLRRALELSYNATAVKLQQLVGGDAVVTTAKNFGISSHLAPYASLALGALEVRLIDLVRAYAGIANLGEVPVPRFITEVYDREGRLKERNFPQSARAMPAPPTYLMVKVLRGVVQRGTGGSAAALGANLAGKTGTTDDYTNAWFLGFSPRITVGVWVGRNLQERIGRNMTGAEAALPIWKRFMADYLETLSEEEREEDFLMPPGVVHAAVDAVTGLRVSADRGKNPACTEKILLEAFLDGTEPIEDCTDELRAVVDLPWPFQQAHYTPRPDEPMPTPEAIAVANERITPSQHKATQTSKPVPPPPTSSAQTSAPE